MLRSEPDPVGPVTRTAAAPPPRPRLRGWSHLVAAGPALAATVVLVLVARGDPGRQVALAVFGVSATWLFLLSGLYHVRSWSPGRRALLRRLDHANIFVLVAGTYTPVVLTVLGGVWKVVLISLVWGIAGLGIAAVAPLLRIPRAALTAGYLVQGWVAIVFLPLVAAAVGLGGLLLLVAGGVLYTAGALCYALKRPRLSPRWFSYHELFHVLVIAADAVFVAFMLAIVIPHAH